MRRCFSPSKPVIPSIEPLEDRQLLSVFVVFHPTAITAAQQVLPANLLGLYSGVLNITRSTGVPLGSRASVLLTITDQGIGGSLNGVLTVAGFRAVLMTGQITGSRFTLTNVFDPNNPGTATYTGTIGSGGATLNGSLFIFFGASSARGTLAMTKVHGPPPPAPTATTTTPGIIQSPGAGAGLSSIFGGGSPGAGAGGQTIGTVSPPVPGSNPIIITTLGTVTTSSGIVIVGLFSTTPIMGML